MKGGMSMAFVDGESGGELSDEVKAENEKYGVLMIMQKEPVQGIYRGFRMVPGYKGNMKNQQKCHSFEQEDGNNLEVRGFGLMDHIIAKDYKEGDLLRVIYTGLVDGYHKCTIAKDDGNGAGSDGGEDL